MSFISYRRHLVFPLFNSVYRAHRTQRPVHTVDKIRFVKYLNIFPFVHLAQSHFNDQYNM